MARLPHLPIQWRSAGRRRPDVRGHRSVRPDEVAGRTGGRTSNEAVLSRACTQGSHTQARQAGTNQTAGNSDNQRSCRDDGCDAGSWNLSSRPTCSRNNTPIAQNAVRWTRSNTSRALLQSRHWQVIDADLSGYFDSIPHAELMKSVARRISDRHMLRLIKMWLVAPVEETDERGRKCRTTRNKDMGRGTPQGAPISPLLSNLYMRRFILGWKVLGYEKRFQAKIVNYADDFVICCRRNADQAMDAMRSIMRKLKLTVNEEKTHVCRLPDESFDFLGYTFGHMLLTTERVCAYISERPSKKKIQAVCRRISELTEPTMVLARRGRASGPTQPHHGRVGELLLPWTCRQTISERYPTCLPQAPSVVVSEAQGAGSGILTLSRTSTCTKKLGLVQLRLSDRNVPWAKA